MGIIGFRNEIAELDIEVRIGRYAKEIVTEGLRYGDEASDGTIGTVSLVQTE